MAKNFNSKRLRRSQRKIQQAPDSLNSNDNLRNDDTVDSSKPTPVMSDKDSDGGWSDCINDDEDTVEGGKGDGKEGDIIEIVDHSLDSGNRKERRTAQAKRPRKDKAAKTGKRSKVKVGKTGKNDSKVKAKGTHPKATKDEVLAAGGPPHNLYDCHSEADILAMRQWQTDELFKKAMAAIDKKSVRQRLGTMYDDCVLAITGEGTDVPTFANDRARTDAYEHTGRALLAMLEANPSWQIVAATLVSGDSVTSSDKTVIDVAKEMAKGRKFAKMVTPHFIGVVEPALFNSHTHDEGGRVIQPHSQMLLIGEEIFEKAEKAAKEYGATLPGNFTDAPQIVVQLVDPDPLNVMKVASYLFKPPYQGKTWCPPQGDKKGHMHHSTKGDRAINFFRMGIILSMLPLDKVIYAGGECKTIKTGVVKDVRANRKSACKNPNRMLAPDTIGSFWFEVIRSLKRKKWWLPAIIF